MAGKLLHAQDQLLASMSSTTPATVPLSLNQKFVLLYLITQGGHAAQWKELPSPLTPLAFPTDYRAQLVVDNSDNLDYCTIQFIGQIHSQNPPTWNNISCYLVCYLNGLTQSGERVQLDNAFVRQHPLERASGYKYPPVADAWLADSIVAPQGRFNSIPPYWGTTLPFAQGSNRGFVSGFLCDPSAPFAAGDQWHINFPIGRQVNGRFGISGLRKIFISLMFLMPGSLDLVVDPDPNPNYLKTIGVNVWAHLYEERDREFD